MYNKELQHDQFDGVKQKFNGIMIMTTAVTIYCQNYYASYGVVGSLKKCILIGIKWPFQ